MRTLERGQDKIQKICDKIRDETIEPAKQEAQQIIESAQKRAEEIIAQAEKQAEQLIKQGRVNIEQERNVFHTSLQQAAKQTIESLRQSIEQKFFNEELEQVLNQELAQPQVVAQLLNGIVAAIEKEGVAADLTAVLPRTVSAEQVNQLLLDKVKQKLKSRPMEIGHFAGGAQVKLEGKRMTLDLTDRTLKELLTNYVRKDFRQTLFGS